MSKIDEYFSVIREDDCIWFMDNREPGIPPMHLVPEQAREIGQRLIAIAGDNECSELLLEQN